jgi:hypothetical protein
MKTKINTKLLLTVISLSLIANLSFAQSPGFLLERDYIDLNKAADFGRKGDIALGDTGFVSTGVEKASGCANESAFLLKTDIDGNALWTILIGKPGFNYQGYSTIKSELHQGYVIVGSTDEGQVFKGVHGGAGCGLIYPYSNAVLKQEFQVIKES